MTSFRETRQLLLVHKHCVLAHQAPPPPAHPARPEGNNLTVSLAVNIEVAAGCTLILSGRKGTQTASTPNPTIAEDGGGAVASSGEWQQALVSRARSSAAVLSADILATCYICVYIDI